MNKLRSCNLLVKKLFLQKTSVLSPFISPAKRMLTSPICRNISYSAPSGVNKNHQKENPFTALMTKADYQIASALEWDETMRNIEDRFHLSKIHDVKKVFSILRQARYNYSLNDLVHFLRRIVEISDEKHLQINPNNSVELSSFISEIKSNLRDSTQEYPLIGSYAWCFWKLNHKDDSELWLTLGDHIIDGRFHPNFNEAMCGLEGFTALNGIADQKFIDEVYKKLERVLVLTILEVNIGHFRRIAQSLVKVNRFTEYVFENVETHLLHFLSCHDLRYDLKLMLDILACFSLSGNGSQQLFYSFQNIFKTFYSLDEEEQKDLIHGNFISTMVQTYALAKMRHPDLNMDNNFSRLVYELVVCDDADYTLEELVNVIQFVGMFGFTNIDEINGILDKRVFDVKGRMKGEDMIRYIDLKVNRDYEENYSELPKEIVGFFDDYFNKNMEKQDHLQVYHYISEIENRKLMYGKEDLMNHLVLYVSIRLHIYDFEDLCYFYWLFNKYFHFIKSDAAKIQCGLSQIKDHIRLYSAFSKGKLQIGSNFYKMLEVVSGSDFLSQGEYPEW